MIIENVSGIYQQTVKVIPVDDMVACLRIKKKEKELKEGAWIRMKKGRYGGDLGKVIKNRTFYFEIGFWLNILFKILDILDGGATLRVKLVPRIDYGKLDKKDDEPGEKRKNPFAYTIQPQKLFNPENVHRRFWTRTKNGGYEFQNEIFDRDGYLEKEVKLATVEIENVNPTLEEITKFSGGTINERNVDLDALAANSAVVDFQVGDSVEIFRGDLKDVTGKVVSLDSEFITILPKDAQLGAIKVDAKDLRKRFNEGDHVRVVRGNHAGEAGLIIKVASNVATLLSDSTMQSVRISNAIAVKSCGLMSIQLDSSFCEGLARSRRKFGTFYISKLI